MGLIPCVSFAYGLLFIIVSDTVKSWLFVTIQGILLVLLVFFTNATSSPPRTLKIIGNVVELIGLVVLLISFYDLRKSLTALPLPKKHGVLQVRGLYKFVRHPMYVGVLVLSLGISIAGNSIAKFLILLALFILFNLKARYEENLLVAKYLGYKEYMKATPRFVPKLYRGR